MLPADLNGVANPNDVAVIRTPRIQSSTQHWKTELQFSGGVVQLCFGFLSYVAFHVAPKAANSQLSLTHDFICLVTSAVLRRCFVASALLRRCFCVASALPSRCLGVASAFVRRSLGCGVASAACAATLVQLRCNFDSIVAQQCVGFNLNLTAGCFDAHLCDLGVVCTTGSC